MNTIDTIRPESKKDDSLPFQNNVLQLHRNHTNISSYDYTNTNMISITRPELDTKLELLETKSNARIERIENTLNEIKDDLRSTRKTVITTVISAVLTIFFGIGGLNYTLIQSMQSSFESGKNTGFENNELKHQSNSIKNELLNIKNELSELKAQSKKTKNNK